VDFTKYKHLTFKQDGKVLTALFNQPAKLNPINNDVEKDLVNLLHEGADDPDFNVLVLGGEGRAFSAGGDIPFMQKVIDDPSLFGTYQPKKTVFSLIDFPKPIVAKVQGPAIGLGATIALLCDVIFASPNAKFGDPHVNVGFTAGDGGAIIWPQLIGYARAKQYLLTGDLVNSAEAERIGLINFVVPAEELDQKVMEFAQRLANGATKSINWTKQLANIGLRQVASGLMDASIAYEALSNITRDHQEAVTAFIEKRKPKFTGD